MHKEVYTYACIHICEPSVSKSPGVKTIMYVIRL